MSPYNNRFGCKKQETWTSGEGGEQRSQKSNMLFGGAVVIKVQAAYGIQYISQQRRDFFETSEEVYRFLNYNKI